MSSPTQSKLLCNRRYIQSNICNSYLTITHRTSSYGVSEVGTVTISLESADEAPSDKEVTSLAQDLTRSKPGFKPRQSPHTYGSRHAASCVDITLPCG